jgi:hypothetical protein
MSIKLSSRERVELNVSVTAIELGLAALSQLTAEMDRAKKTRGGDAPYRIANNTGHDIRVWIEGRLDTAKTIRDGAATEWAFEDWRTAREVSVSKACLHSRLTSSSAYLDGHEAESRFYSDRRETLGGSTRNPR